MSPSTPNTRNTITPQPLSAHEPSHHNSHNPLKRPRSPVNYNEASTAESADDKTARDERLQGLMRDLYSRSERLIGRVFQNNRHDPSRGIAPPSPTKRRPDSPVALPDAGPPQAKKPVTRTIDEDDYGDDEDDEDDADDEDGGSVPDGSPLSSRDRPNQPSSTSDSAFRPSSSSILKPPLERVDPSSAPVAVETSEETRKKLEEAKKASEDAAKESFQAMFYTLENDRDAMLEQQKLDELDRQVESEMSGTNANAPGPETQGTLSTTNLGASSLTLKHLFARIDANRGQVKATDSKLRTLISEVRKNRSKWASEERVGQEELYEAAERVLMELKSMTEYAGPFLTRVKRTDAPDYFKVIKEPMDLGTMMKKLSKAQYDSKKDFCHDLNLIWANCLAFNTRPDHPFRKKAVHMQKETSRLIPLIPDIVIRDRKDVEREEQQLEQMDDLGGSDSDEDDRPIAATRGRKAPSKSSKRTGQARKAPTGDEDGVADVDVKPRPTMNALASVRHDLLKSDVDSIEGSQHGFSTPPPGSSTPLGLNGAMGSAAPPSHADPNDIEAVNGSNLSGTLPADEPEEEDEEYRIWKRVTKKDRARAASERHRLFRDDRLNVEEPALLRTRRGMRRWLKQQQAQLGPEGDDSPIDVPEMIEAGDTQVTLTEDITRDEDSTLPDYYDPVSGIPLIDSRLEWVTDSDGQVLDRRDDCLRLLPKGIFVSPTSELAAKLERNMRQMQDTRKIVAKIGIVKQMQLQTQTYQNQFQKYAPEPFLEADIAPMVVSDDGPIMCPTISRAALQRSVGKILYAAGFEEFQPSAIEVITDIAGDYFAKLVKTLKLYTELPSLDSTAAEGLSPADRPSYTPEEAVLHSLYQNGLDLNEMDAYVSEICSTMPAKLEMHHVRMRDHYAELLRPALDPTAVGNDGVGAFTDGNEAQFVAGDFAEDIGEDFFGFRELGLDREFGLAGLSVPLHLLQSRISSLNQQVDPSAAAAIGTVMEQPEPYAPVTAETLLTEINLIQDYFQDRLEKTEDSTGPLIEDEELPAKQRFPKPRLPPNGKISSPRKRPLREQQMLARKRKRAEIEAERQRERQAEEGGASANSVGPSSALPGEDAVGDIDDSAEPAKKVPKLTNGVSSYNVNSKAKSGANSLRDSDDGSAAALPNRDNDDKPLSKLRLDPPKDKRDGNLDPEKKQSGRSGGDTGGNANGDDSNRDKDEPNGLLSPDSNIEIAAH